MAEDQTGESQWTRLVSTLVDQRRIEYGPVGTAVSPLEKFLPQVLGLNPVAEHSLIVVLKRLRSAERQLERPVRVAVRIAHYFHRLLRIIAIIRRTIRPHVMPTH
eukprot:SAG11_NODE_688_length_7716_cov_10.091637_3_plen_105_part_00